MTLEFVSGSNRGRIPTLPNARGEERSDGRVRTMFLLVSSCICK